MTPFMELCVTRRALGKYVCVGLDPDPKQIPDCVQGRTDAERVFHFLSEIITATHEYAMCYKVQSACFEAMGPAGLKVLRAIIRFVSEVDLTIPVILDFKRGDIGRTNQAYVEFAFGYGGADAVTVHPYLGMEAMDPFLAETDKTVFVLCRTSNAGAGEFQDLTVTPVEDDEHGGIYASVEAALVEDPSLTSQVLRTAESPIPLYEFVALRVARHWNTLHGNCGLVVGATYPRELARIRHLAPDLPILIPGVGTQGGDLDAAVRFGFRGGALGVINSSSGILYAYKTLRHDGGRVFSPEEYPEAAAHAARVMNEDIARALLASR